MSVSDLPDTEKLVNEAEQVIREAIQSLIDKGDRREIAQQIVMQNFQRVNSDPNLIVCGSELIKKTT